MSWLFDKEYFSDPKEGKVEGWGSMEELAENNFNGMHKKVPLSFYHTSECAKCSNEYFWNNWNSAITIVKVMCPFCKEVEKFRIR